jgi:hypothetical protein
VTSTPKRDPSPSAASISERGVADDDPELLDPGRRHLLDDVEQIGLLAIGTSCFALVCVIGRRRVPAPPARIRPS